MQSEQSAETASGQQAPFEINTSRQFVNWLVEQKLSIGLTTYQSGKLFMLGHNPKGEMSVFERTFDRPMGLYADSGQLWLSTLYTLYRFVNGLPQGKLQDGFDRQYIPQVGYITGDLDIHDVAPDATGRPVFINTLFSCIATTDQEHSFKPLWKPHFISDLAPEDRCHLNGMAMRDGQPAFVSAVAQSDIVDGWRSHRSGGGIVMDVAKNAVVCEGLSMPHSPRWYRDQLWVANSGSGELGVIDLKSGRFEPRLFLPGYIRGLAFHGDWAVVGLSKPRHNKTFSGLPLDAALERHKVEARCGIYVVHLERGHIEHWAHFEGMVSELYDVVTLAGVNRASFIGFRNDQVRRTLHIGS